MTVPEYTKPISEITKIANEQELSWEHSKGRVLCKIAYELEKLNKRLENDTRETI